jgi:hypothetical protein
MKILKSFAVTCVFCSIFISSIYSSYASGGGDFEYWNNESMEFKISKNLAVKTEEEFRFKDNASVFYHNYTDAGLDYAFNKHLNMGINYRHINEKRGKKDWDPEYRPHFNGTIKTEWRDFKLKNRARFEWRIREDRDTAWRWRDSVSVEFPLKLKPFDIQPYVSDELFFDFDEGRFTKNRVYMGLKTKFLENLSGETFYMLQSSETGDNWITCHVWGTKIKLAF